MMKNLKKLIMLFIFTLLFHTNSVYAVQNTYDANQTRVCFNYNTGEYISSYTGTDLLCGQAIDSVKLIENEYAYCMEWKLSHLSRNLELDTTWSANSGEAILLGYMIKQVQAKYPTFPESYAMTGAMINTFFAQHLGNSNSTNYYAVNSNIKQMYDAAITSFEADGVTLSTSLPSITITAGNSRYLKYTSSKYYLSEKITVNGLKNSYGGGQTDAAITYKITANAKDGTAYICSKANGTGCISSNQVSLTPTSSTYSFYVKYQPNGSEATVSSPVSISVVGTNSSTYPSAIRYVNSDYSNSQKLIVEKTVTINRSTSRTLSLLAPNLVNHTISAYKYNSLGEDLSGATLEIYKDDVTNSSNLLASNKNGSNEVTYVGPKVVESSDDFFSHNYYLVEKSAPDGYVLKNQVITIYNKDRDNQEDAVTDHCYNTTETDEESVEVDMEHCNFENYIYKCKPSDGTDLIDLNTDESCNFEISTPEEPEDENNSGNTENNTTTEENNNESTENNDENTDEPEVPGTDTEDPEETPEITYEKVCYNISKNSIAEETYCKDKGNYTKVESADGNLVVFQTNEKNIVRISKKSVTGDKEIKGASLKICTDAEYVTQKENCSPATTIDDIEMSWISSNNPREFVGLRKGSYYIVETTPPAGYIKATTATKFSIDELGNVTSGETVITNADFIEKSSAIVIQNELNVITISKQDLATSKELPGATLSICRAYKDQNNEYQMLKDQYTEECIPATLASGKEATWVSTNEPKEIKGLPVGTYYLVEKIAPTDYDTAEAILFTLKSDGTLTDANGKTIADEKLVMKDKAINDVKTGQFSKYTVAVILGIVIILGVSSYYFLKGKTIPTKIENSSNTKKIRKRKIYKK